MPSAVLRAVKMQVAGWSNHDAYVFENSMVNTIHGLFTCAERTLLHSHRVLCSPPPTLSRVRDDFLSNPQQHLHYSGHIHSSKFQITAAVSKYSKWRTELNLASC
eukprot:COSAG02_NODE_2286_length_9213_cov_149.155914_5_plen_105_part_00